MAVDVSKKVFMTRRDVIECQHEPFSDPYYFGPEFISERFRDDPAARQASPASKETYQSILDSLDKVQKQLESDPKYLIVFTLPDTWLNSAESHRRTSPIDHRQSCPGGMDAYLRYQGKRVFVKDMAYYFFHPDGRPAKIAPSLGGVEEPNNPTVLPVEVLRHFHFAFLIRHPRRSIPSYYCCTIPPLSDKTGPWPFLACEAVYKELVELFDFLVREKIVDKERVTVVDADDLLDHPEEMIKRFCDRTSVDFTPGMLVWDEADDQYAAKVFAKWNEWHDDVLDSSRLNGRTQTQVRLDVDARHRKRLPLLTRRPNRSARLWNQRTRSGRTSTAQRPKKLIREVVDANIPHYEYLKQFRMRMRSLSQGGRHFSRVTKASGFIAPEAGSAEDVRAYIVRSTMLNKEPRVFLLWRSCFGLSALIKSPQSR